MLHGSLGGTGVWERMDTCVCMAEALCCSPETTRTLLIGSTPIQNKKFKKKKRVDFEQGSEWHSKASQVSVTFLAGENQCKGHNIGINSACLKNKKKIDVGLFLKNKISNNCI